MALGRLSTISLEALLRDRIPNRDDSTDPLTERLGAARARGYLTKAEFQAACRWKTPRSAAHVASNHPATIRKATAIALSDTRDRERMEALLTLRGVSVPTASAILTLIDPERFGVIDIRVWQLLHRLGYVEGARSGTGLTVAHWMQFQAVIRAYAARFETSARRIELALFALHEEHQQGTLYR